MSLLLANKYIIKYSHISSSIGDLEKATFRHGVYIRNDDNENE